MKADNKIIQSLWIGESLGPMEQTCVRSYLASGHEFHLYAYQHITGVPAGAQLKDASRILPQKDVFVDEFGGFVNLSNLFRYTLLWKIGGWWVDMDTVCLKAFDFDDEFVFSSEYAVPHDRYQVNTTFIKSPPGAAYLLDCIEFIQHRGHQNLHWGELGVNLISRMIFSNQLAEHVLPFDVFCPVSAYELPLLIHRSDYRPPSSSYALHWWNEVWRRSGIDKSGSFPNRCLYEEMKRRFS